MKRIFLIIALIAITIPISAQHLVVERTGGESETITLENLKQITFNGTIVNIEQNNGTMSSIGMGDISRVYFSALTSISDIELQREKLVEYISCDEIAINDGAGSMITIYSVTGVQMLSCRLETEAGIISIANLPRGIYIVKANERTEKIIKR